MHTRHALDVAALPGEEGENAFAPDKWQHAALLMLAFRVCAKRHAARPARAGAGVRSLSPPIAQPDDCILPPDTMAGAAVAGA